MKVEFEADYQDLAETSYQAWKYDTSNRHIFPHFVTYLLFAGVCSIPVFLFAKMSLFAGALVFVFVFFLSLYFYRLPTKQYFVNECIRRVGKDSFRVVIELTERGVKTEQLEDEFLFGWSNVKTISETDDRIYFYLGNGYGTSVPKRAFNNPAHLGSFIAYAKSHVISMELLPE